MFLNIRKIGKAKHKFKAKFILLKLTNEATPRGTCFKVQICRGSHTIQALSEPSRKGIAKFEKVEYKIPITLFYEAEEKEQKYLEKQATIKVYQSDDQGKQIRKIGQKTIDLAGYADKGELQLQVQLDPQKKKDSPQVILQICLERQDDDSKSIQTGQTYSNNNDKVNQSDRRLHEKSQEKNQVKLPIKSIISPGKTTLTSQEKESDCNDKKKIEGEKKLSKQELEQNIQNISDKDNAFEVQEGSSDLQVFLLKKALKQKQLQMASVRKQNQILKKTIQKMVQESSTAKQAQKMAGFESQIKQLKKMLVIKDTEIDRLATANKTLSARQENHQKIIMRLREETLLNKQKISDMKYRQAYLMQELFQTANKEGLEDASRFLAV